MRAAWIRRDSKSVIFTLLVVDADDHGECGAEGDDADDGAGPGPLALLDLHPAVDVVAAEVELDDVDVGDADGRLRHALLVVVVPLAPQTLRLVPHLKGRRETIVRRLDNR